MSRVSVVESYIGCDVGVGIIRMEAKGASVFG